MKLAFAVLILGFVSVQTLPTGDKHGQLDLKALQNPSNYNNRIIMNDYFDALLTTVTNTLVNNGLSTIPVPGAHLKYGAGALDLTEGTVGDLSSLARTGDADVTYGLRVIRIKAAVGFEVLQLNYKYKATLLNVGPGGGIEALVTGLAFDVNLSVDTFTGKISLDTLDVSNNGNLRIKFTGTPILDPILNVLANAVTNIFADTVINLIVAVIKGAFGAL